MQVLQRFPALNLVRWRPILQFSKCLGFQMEAETTFEDFIYSFLQSFSFCLTRYFITIKLCQLLNFFEQMEYSTPDQIDCLVPLHCQQWKGFSFCNLSFFSLLGGMVPSSARRILLSSNLPGREQHGWLGSHPRPIEDLPSMETLVSLVLQMG